MHIRWRTRNEQKNKIKQQRNQTKTISVNINIAKRLHTKMRCLHGTRVNKSDAKKRVMCWSHSKIAKHTHTMVHAMHTCIHHIRHKIKFIVPLTESKSAPQYLIRTHTLSCLILIFFFLLTVFALFSFVGLVFPFRCCCFFGHCLALLCL